MMRRSQRHPPGEINAGSMADIAFLLLIFFLVTTTMDTDKGILRLLPPIVDDVEITDVTKERDVYKVLVNDADMLLVEGELMDIRDLRAGAREFMTNPSNRDDLPEKKRVTRQLSADRINELRIYMQQATDPELKDGYRKDIEVWEEKIAALTTLDMNDYMELPGSALISLQTGSRTSYNMYVQVQNELEAAIRELRDELAKERIGRRFSDLNELDENDRAYIKAIRMIIPQRISEAEPVEVKKN